MHTVRDAGHLPDARETGQGLDISEAAVVDAYRELHDRHVVVLEPGAADRLRMANPFSAVPTSFRVSIGNRWWWGNCIWDGLGIIAALGGNGTLATVCPDCGQPQAVTIADAVVQHGTGLAYVGVPAHSWWENIIYT